MDVVDEESDGAQLRVVQGCDEFAVPLGEIIFVVCWVLAARYAGGCGHGPLVGEVSFDEPLPCGVGFVQADLTAAGWGDGIGQDAVGELVGGAVEEVGKPSGLFVLVCGCKEGGPAVFLGGSDCKQHACDVAVEGVDEACGALCEVRGLAGIECGVGEGCVLVEGQGDLGFSLRVHECLESWDAFVLGEVYEKPLAQLLLGLGDGDVVDVPV